MKEQIIRAKGQNTSLPKVSLREAIVLWLSSYNRVFSLLFEKEVTNRQALLVINFLLALMCCISGMFISVWSALAFVTWLAASVVSLKKEGL